MPATPDDDRNWIKPKWLVIVVAVAAFGLILSYDVRLGLAAGVLLGVIGGVWLYLALRYGSLSGAPSGRRALVAQFRQQSSNRRRAAARSGPQQSPDPAERP
jgi:hypothetical protein